MALTKSEIKFFLSLQSKRGRKRENRFLAEGVRLLEEALSAGYLPQEVLYSPADLTPRGKHLIDGFSARRVPSRTISAKECQRLSDTESSQGIVALFGFPDRSLEQQLDRGYRRVLVCDRLGDPGNLGTLLRSAAAFRFELVVMTAGSAEATNPKSIRAGMGAFFRLPVVEDVDDAKLVSELKRRGYKIYNADVKGKYISGSLPVAEKMALVIGSEASGTGAALAAEANYHIKIPMAKHTESLNSAMAGTVLMFWFDALERVK